MPDNQLDILIKFGLSKEKATEAVGELKKIEKTTEAVTAKTAKLTDETERYQAQLKKWADATQEQADAEAYSALKADLSAAAQERKRIELEETIYAQSELKQLTKTYSQEEADAILNGKQGQEELTEATKKTVGMKGQLKDMVKGIGREFPVLGNIGRLALNPIAFATASIVASFQIWKHRTDELTKSLGGIEMADFSESQVERIERMGAAFAKMSAANAGQSAFAKIKSDAEAMLALIKDNDELFKAMGIDTGTKSLADQAIVKGSMAASLEAAGRANIAAAGTPMSLERESQFREKILADAKDAEAKKAEHEDRRDAIADYRNSLANPAGTDYYMRMFQAARFRSRYGPDLSPDRAFELEQGNVDEQQNRLNRFGQFTRQSGVRAGRRERRTIGQGQLDQAASADSEVLSLLRQIAAASAGRALAGSPNPEGGVSDPALIKAQIQYFRSQPGMMADIERALAAQERIKARIDNLERR